MKKVIVLAFLLLVLPIASVAIADEPQLAQMGEDYKYVVQPDHTVEFDSPQWGDWRLTSEDELTISWLPVWDEDCAYEGDKVWIHLSKRVVDGHESQTQNDSLPFYGWIATDDFVELMDAIDLQVLMC